MGVNKMIKVQGKLSKNLVVACSGGPDSMAIADFLRRKHNLKLHFVHHKTDASEEAFQFLKNYSNKNDIDFVYSYIDETIPNGVSQEEHWRNQRYKFFYQHKIPVVTGHHLDDCVETWIWSCMHGEGKIIPYSNGNVIRPFRLNKKENFYDWCHRHNIPYVEDKSNNDTKYMRNYIRHEMIPHVLKVNPGIHKVIKKKIISENI